MPTRYLSIVCFIVCFAAACGSNSGDKSTDSVKADDSASAISDALPSWNDGPIKKSIIDYVTDVTKEGSPDFIPVSDRIATFDNDGTLWSEQPVYFQFFYALDQVKAMAPAHPEWKNKQPFKAVLMNDMAALMKQGDRGILQLVAVSHSGMTTSKFDSSVKQWLDTAQHPTKHKHYTELVYQPMLELLKYLQANHFKVFIVSGGGVDFMRAWAEEAYGIPRDQIIGSSIKARYDYNNGQPVIRKIPELEFIDDGDGKPEAINRFIGRKPVFACGNSDGDLQMLRWAASNNLKNFELYIHHTDSAREWAYDRKSHIGTFDKGLDEATQKKWPVADMKEDWKVVYPFEK